MPTGQADPAPSGNVGTAREVKAQLQGTGKGRVGAFRLEGTQENRRPGDITGGQRGGFGSHWERVSWRL